MSRIPRNPFMYGHPVEGAYFTDRDADIHKLLVAAKSKTHLFIISPRRYGKTSMLFEFQRRLNPKRYLSMYVDLYSTPSLEDLVSTYVTGISKSETLFQRQLSLAKELIQNIKPAVEIDEEGKPVLTVDFSRRNSGWDTLKQILDQPEKIAKKRGKHFVVIFDEFQEILKVGGAEIEKVMRSVLEKHKNVTYIFSGSKKDVLRNMVMSKTRPFYKMGEVYELPPISDSDYERFIVKKFRKFGVQIEHSAVSAILNLSSKIPNNVQYLSNKVWENRGRNRTINSDNVKECFNLIIDEQNSTFYEIWELLSLGQRKLLLALVKYGGKNVYSGRFLQSSTLSLGSVQKWVQSLIEHDTIERTSDGVKIADPLFEAWVLRLSTH